MKTNELAEVPTTGVAMLAKVLLVMASAVVALWGIMHIAKTRAVVAGFEPLTDDNRHVLRMEWIIEGVALTFVSALVLGATFILGVQTPGAKFVYIMSVTFLLVLALVSLFTGAKASPLPYKLCAPIFTTSAVLIWIGGFIV